MTGKQPGSQSSSAPVTRSLLIHKALEDTSNHTQAIVHLPILIRLLLSCTCFLYIVKISLQSHRYTGVSIFPHSLCYSCILLFPLLCSSLLSFMKSLFLLSLVLPCHIQEIIIKAKFFSYVFILEFYTFRFSYLSLYLELNFVYT